MGKKVKKMLEKGGKVLVFLVFLFYASVFNLTLAYAEEDQGFEETVEEAQVINEEQISFSTNDQNQVAVLDSETGKTQEENVEEVNNNLAEETLQDPSMLSLESENQEPEQPSEVLIVGVYFAENGSRYVEIYNPSNQDIDISGWYLTDNENNENQDESIYQFPENTILPAYSYLVVAYSAEDLYNTFGYYPDFEIEESDEIVPNLEEYFSGSSSFDLDPLGDEVILKDNIGAIVDDVSWGASAYDTPFVSDDLGYDISIERKNVNDSYVDTGSSADDFEINEYAIPFSYPYVKDFKVDPASPSNSNTPQFTIWPVDFSVDYDNLWVYLEDEAGNLFRAKMNLRLPNSSFVSNDGLSYEKQVGENEWQEVDFVDDGKYGVYVSLTDMVGNYYEWVLFDEYEIDTQTPLAPTELSIIEVTWNSVALSWKASESLDVVGYKVFYGTDKNNLENFIDVGNSLKAVIVKLLPETLYYFVVKAYDAAGNESEASSIVFSVTLKEPPVPQTTLSTNIQTSFKTITLAKSQEDENISQPEEEKEIKGETASAQEEAEQNGQTSTVNWLPFLIALILFVVFAGGVELFSTYKKQSSLTFSSGEKQEKDQEENSEKTK